MPETVAVMQPTYLPWLGYFDLMDQVDAFVLLDDVQFSKQSWQQRNRIKGPQGLQWLTVPVLHKGRIGQQIDETAVRDPGFWRKHLRTIEMNYAKAPHLGTLFPALSALFERGDPWATVVDVNAACIAWVAERLGIETPLVRSSTLAARDERRHRVPDLCAALAASTYLSPPGAADYMLGELDAYTEQGLAVRFHAYEHPTYRQLHGDFCPFASALDLLLNEGPASLEILRSGRRPALPPEALAEASA